MRALIIGISGQDGAYLADLLLQKGYEVVGTSRDAAAGRFEGLVRLGIRERVRLRSLAPSSSAAVLTALAEVEPDEVYNLSGQSSVGVSFERPVETVESVTGGTLAVLEAIRVSGRAIRLFNAGSGECFGDTGGEPADEDTPMRPRSPYAAAKAAAHFLLATYRESFGLFACTGILYNHESPLRSERFVTRKITAAARRIAREGSGSLRLGNMAVRRDWGWAPEYAEAMWRMLQQPRPDDYVLATGASRPLEDFVAAAFGAVGLEWRKHVTSDPLLYRPTDIEVVAANPAKAERVLGWRARTGLEEIAATMVSAEANAGGP